MRRSGVRLTTLIMLALCAGVPVTSGAQTPSVVPIGGPDRALVSAIGRGEVHVVPDRAFITIAVETRDSSARLAATDNARQMTTTLAALHGAGVADTAIVTNGFSVGLDYRPVAPVIGPATSAQHAPTFVARNTMRVSVTSLASVGRILDAALAGGATQIGQVQFTSSRLDEARRTALTQAVEHARTDAETTARALGRSLGDLIEVTTQGASMPSTSYYELMGAPMVAGVAGGVSRAVISGPVGPTTLAAGDVVIGETVIVRWRLAPKP